MIRCYQATCPFDMTIVQPVNRNQSDAQIYDCGRSVVIFVLASIISGLNVA